MRQDRLVTGLAGAFGLMTAMLLFGSIFVPPLLVPAVLFAAVTYLVYFQASGRLMERIYGRVERQAATGQRETDRGGFGAGPREDWTPPRQEQRQRARERVRQQRQRTRRRARQQQVHQSGPTRSEALSVLGLDASADEEAVKRAYRERIKEVHPDADGGDEAEFKRVQEAYDALTD